jgi:hypothetical protein
MYSDPEFTTLLHKKQGLYFQILVSRRDLGRS